MSPRTTVRELAHQAVDKVIDVTEGAIEWQNGFFNKYGDRIATGLFGVGFIGLTAQLSPEQQKYLIPGLFAAIGSMYLPRISPKLINEWLIKVDNLLDDQDITAITLLTLGVVGTLIGVTEMIKIISNIPSPQLSSEIFKNSLRLGMITQAIRTINCGFSPDNCAFSSDINE